MGFGFVLFYGNSFSERNKLGHTADVDGQKAQVCLPIDRISRSVELLYGEGRISKLQISGGEENPLFCRSIFLDFKNYNFCNILKCFLYFSSCVEPLLYT